MIDIQNFYFDHLVYAQEIMAFRCSLTSIDHFHGRGLSWGIPMSEPALFSPSGEAKRDAMRFSITFMGKLRVKHAWFQIGFYALEIMGFRCSLTSIDHFYGRGWAEAYPCPPAHFSQSGEAKQERYVLFDHFYGKLQVKYAWFRSSFELSTI